MRLLFDECFPRSLKNALQRRGHDVHWVHEVMPGASGAVVLEAGTAALRIIVTEDRDFGTLIYRDGKPAVGVVAVYASDLSAALPNARMWSPT